MNRSGSLPSTRLQLAPKEHWIGNPSLLALPSAVILNSRQGKYPVGADPWIQSTIKAVAWCTMKEMTLLTGIGMNTWELSLWVTAELMGQLVVLVGVPGHCGESLIRERCDSVINDFKLVKQYSLLVPYYESSKRGSGKSDWETRDRFLLHQANTILPVSLRPDSTLWKKVLEDRLESKVNEVFRVPYAPRRMKMTRPPPEEAVSRALEGMEWEFLTHWTRIRSAPWPDESRWDYYHDIVNSGSGYPRNAFQTLRHILEQGVIHGTGWRMPGNTPAVSLTALHPSRMIGHMRYRKRYVRPSFEPYGIAIRKYAAEVLGARQVHYGSKEQMAKLKANDRLFFQAAGPEDTDWPSEEEWRMKGDLVLRDLEKEDILILVPGEEEREELVARFPYPVQSLG